MSEFSRLKSMVGAHKELATVASAATVNVPDVSNAFYLSGTTTITSLSVPQHIRNRKVTFIGAASSGVKFTNTSTLTTAGQMYLKGADLTLTEDSVIELFCKNDGTWILVGTTIA